LLLFTNNNIFTNNKFKNNNNAFTHLQTINKLTQLLLLLWLMLFTNKFANN